jgi:nicotinate phosphoribosyltransferase
METALLGFVCQASGVATAAARVRKAAGDKLVLSFGARRMHPAITPMISRSTYIGGLDGESCILGAKRIGINPTGTMPHSLIIMFGDQVKAWKAYDELMPPEVTRVALVDTYFDEKIESVMAAEALGKKLWGVRLDTPGSRRGSFEDIIKEVRWELDIRGYNYVKIFLSGGLNDESVKSLKEAGADGFGVGTWISNAPTVDFSMDVVEVEGKPVAKRGKFGGKKNIWRCRDCLIDIVLPADKPSPKCPKCGEQTESMLKPLIKNGKIVADLPKATEIRKYVLSQLDKVELNLITK